MIADSELALWLSVFRHLSGQVKTVAARTTSFRRRLQEHAVGNDSDDRFQGAAGPPDSRVTHISYSSLTFPRLHS
jgi:hypothetical protein